MGSCPDADIDSTRFNKNGFALALHFDTEFSELKDGVFSSFWANRLDFLRRNLPFRSV